MPSVDLADVRPTVLSWVIVGIMALTFITAAKFITAAIPIPGVSPLVASV
jgi:hypothetical protein